MLSKEDDHRGEALVVKGGCEDDGFGKDDGSSFAVGGGIGSTQGTDRLLNLVITMVTGDGGS